MQSISNKAKSGWKLALALLAFLFVGCGNVQQQFVHRKKNPNFKVEKVVRPYDSRYLSGCQPAQGEIASYRLIVDFTPEVFQVIEVLYSNEKCEDKSMKSASAVLYTLEQSEQGVGTFLAYRNTNFELAQEDAVRVIFDSGIVTLNGVVLKKQRR